MSLSPAILGASDYDPSTSGTTTPTVTASQIQVPSPSIFTTDPPPPPAGWPDPFMSYAASGPITLTGVSGATISYKSFQNLVYPQRPITLIDCDNITIERIDSRRCSMGLLYAYNTTNLTIRWCRVENILGPHERPGGENRANVYQLNGCDTFTCHDIKARYGDTEDAFSHFASNNGTVYNLEWEGATTTSRPTSDGSASIPWESDSGTGCILGDGDGDNVNVSDSTFINPGQVGIAIAAGNSGSYTNCIVVSDSGRAADGWQNVGGYITTFYGACSANSFINNRIWFSNTNHFWDGGTCTATTYSGNTWGDGTLNIEDYRVVL